MPRGFHVEDCSRIFLEGVAKSLARTIDTGETHNSEGLDLRVLLDDVIAQIPHAPEYEIDHRERQNRRRR